jgi:hypothetical protein
VWNTEISTGARANTGEMILRGSEGRIDMIIGEIRHNFAAGVSCDWSPRAPLWGGWEFHRVRQYCVIVIPMIWFALPLSLVAGWMWWMELRGRTREFRGCCLRCGYDLSGSGGGVCPECGAAVPVEAAG